MTPAAIRLWQLISPTLPIGAYSYSQALEYAIDSGMLRGEHDVQQWVAGLLEHGIARVDLPTLVRVHAAWTQRDAAEVQRLSRELVARRETSELRLEDLGMGGALAQLLKSLGVEMPARELPFASAFAIATVEWSIPLEEACMGYAWTWCEAQVAAAVKLVPLGHTAGQRVLLALGERIPAAVVAGLACGDDDIGFGMPGFAIASARHETQYTRLFRS